MARYESIWDGAKDIWSNKIPNYIKYCGATILIASLASFFSYEGTRYMTSVPSQAAEQTDQTKKEESSETKPKDNKKSQPAKPNHKKSKKTKQKNPNVNVNINNKKINPDLKYNGANNYSLELNYGDSQPNLTTTPEATSEGNIPIHSHTQNQNTIQPNGKLDGYNLVAKFFPEGYRSQRPGESAKSSSLEIITENNDSGRTTLSSIKPGQYIIIQPNDFDKEKFLREIEIYYNSEDAKKYFNLSATDKSIFITPKIEYFQGINSGTLEIRVPIKNKYGTTEQETLEIILGK